MSTIAKLFCFILLALNISTFSQSFLTFSTTKELWAIEKEEFKANPTLFKVKDKTLNGFKPDPVLDIFTIIYYNETHHLGLEIDTKILDSIAFVVEGVSVDPIALEDGTYDGKTYIIDVSETVKKHIIASYQGKDHTPEEVQAKVKEVLPKYLKMGGQLILKIWTHKELQPQLFRILPEKYGFSYYNKTLPLTAQYAHAFKNEDMKDLVNIYYPFQYVLQAPDRIGVNRTAISKRISFGPFVLARLGNDLSIQGGGCMLGLALSGKGIPVAGFGIGYSRILKDKILVTTLNPIELGRLLFNPSELWID